LFIQRLKTEPQSELDYLSSIINADLTTDNIDTYRDSILKVLDRCYTGTANKTERIRWIVYGYLYEKNRKFEDWLPSVNSKFRDYDMLPVTNQIRFHQYANKSLNGGLTQLEEFIARYNRQ
jgi:hypothetical protein